MVTIAFNRVNTVHQLIYNKPLMIEGLSKNYVKLLYQFTGDYLLNFNFIAYILQHVQSDCGF